MRKIDNLGRIVIPKDFRYILDIKNNDELNIDLKDDKIIISKPGKSEAEQRVEELEKENKQLKNDLEFVLEQVLGAFIQNWCIDWGFADIRKKYSIDDNYDWKDSNE